MRAVEQVPAFVGRSSAEILRPPDQVEDRVVKALREAQLAAADPDGGVTVAGRLLEEVIDPFVLEMHRPVQPEDSPSGLPVRREFKAVCKAAGIGGSWTPRELRHSFVSLMSSSGVPVEEIARLAGHSSSRTTEVVYRRELRPVLTTGAEAMDRLFEAHAS